MQRGQLAQKAVSVQSRDLQLCEPGNSLLFLQGRVGPSFPCTPSITSVGVQEPCQAQCTLLSLHPTICRWGVSSFSFCSRCFKVSPEIPSLTRVSFGSLHFNLQVSGVSQPSCSCGFVVPLCSESKRCTISVLLNASGAFKAQIVFHPGAGEECVLRGGWVKPSTDVHSVQPIGGAAELSAAHSASLSTGSDHVR